MSENSELIQDHEVVEPEEETSTTARFQILNQSDGSSNLDFIWPNEEGIPADQLEEEGVQDAGFIEVETLEQNDLDTMIALQGLDYKLGGEIRDLLNQVATAIWERAKIEFKGE